MHHAHIPGHDDVVHAGVLEGARDTLVSRQRIAVGLLGERHGLDACGLGALKSIGARTRGDHELDRRVERARRDTVDDGLEVCPTTADEDAQPDGRASAHCDSGTCRNCPAHRYITLPLPSPSTHSPITKDERPSAPSASRTASTLSAPTMRLMPTPMLKVLYASSGVSPASRTQ